MASNTSTFTLRLRTEGMDQAQAQSQAIRDNLQAAQGTSPGAGSTSSRRVASSAAARPTGAAGASAGAFSGQEVEDYNRARGAAGAAGGSARDFADQARGLGGLVRVYATVAANAFAAAAAFTALSNAMDTSNMVKGLDQLGAASGISLGSLSKELVKSTNGAISLREAMEATAKATSAGLSSSQVIELGKAATKASQALGLNLTDAVSRLSRGISKLEPELLDELGIYVKIDDAVEKYARTLGKTANSLTDYERRQAFATEALSQANKKFGEIELDTNPYTKLSASLKDIVQTSAEFINKFLGPVVKYLSESPVALGLAVAFVAKAVLQQALPALGQYRDSLKAATIDTAKRAQELVKIQKELTESRDTSASLGAISALKETQAMKARLEQLKATAQTFSKSAGADYSKKADVDPFAMTEAEVGKLEKRLELRAKVLDRTNSAEAAALRAHIVEIRAIRQEGDNAGEAAQAAVEARDNKFYSQLSITRVKELRALKQANRASILEETNKTQSLEGALAAWKKLNEELAKPKREISLGIDPDTGEQITAIVEKTKGLFGYVERGATRLRGGFGIAFQAVSDFAEAWGPKIAMVVGVATAAFEALDSWLSTNKKELQEFSQATESADNAVKLVGDTLDRISKQELGAALLPQNLEARAKAFVELSNTIEKTAESFEALNKTSSWWDNLVDSVKGLASRGRLDDLGKTLSKQINSALDAVSLDDRVGLETSLKSILDVAELDTTAIVQALKKAGTEGGALLAEQISKSVKTVSEKSAVDAAKLKEALSVLDNINKSYENLATSLKDSSPLASFASGLIQGSIDAQQALTNTNNSISYFRELLKDPKKLRLFDENSIRLAKDYQTQIDNAAKTIQTIEVELKKAEKAFDQTFAEAQVNELGILIVPTIDEAKQNELREKIQEGLKAKAKLDLDVESIKGKLAGLLEQPLIKGMQIATQEFQKSMQKVQLDVMSSLVSRLTGPGKAEAEFEIQKQRIEIEKSSISAMYELTRAVEKNSITIKQIDTEKALRERGEKLGTAGGLQVKDTEYLRLETLAKEYTAGAEVLDKGLKLTGDDFDKLRKVFPNVAKELISFFQTTMGTKAKLGQQEGQLKVGEIAKQFGMSEESFKVDQTRRKEEQELLNITKERESLLSNIYGIENTSLIISKQTASTAAEQKTQESARADISQRISTAEFVINRLNEEKIANGGKLDSIMQKSLDAAIQTKDEEQKQLQAFEQQTAAKNRLLKIQNEIEKISSQTAAEQKKLDFDKQRSDAAVELQQITLNAAKQEFDSLVSKGALSEEYAAEKTAQFALEAQQIQYNKQLSDAGAQKRIQDLQVEEQYRKAIAAGGNELDALIEWGAQTAKNNTLYQDRITNINAVNTQTSRGIEITRQQSLETAKQTEELKKQAEILGLFQGIADTLAQAFGKTGEVLGKFVGTIGEVIDNQETYNKKRAEQSKIIDEVAGKADAGYLSPDDMAKMNQAAKTRNDLDKKNAAQELSNNAKILGSAKTLFKEKTVAYKVLAGAEKAMHIASLAMQAKELFVKVMASKTVVATKVGEETANTATTQAGAASRAPTYIGEIYGKTIGQLGPIAGPVVAAGLAALVLSYLGGGSVKAPPGGFTAKEQQSAQGTGQVYRDGKLVDTGAGVLGDATAKSESVAKGISLLEKYSFKNLEYSNNMLDALKAIEENTKSFAGSLLKAIPGINLTPETLKSGNWLFGKETTETLDRGIKVIGTVGQIIDRSAKLTQYTQTKTTDSGFLGIIGGDTTYGGGEEVIQSTKLDKELSMIFSSMGEALGEAGKTLGITTAEAVNTAFRGIDLTEQLKVSLMGLTGTEAAEAFLSVISSGLDTAALALFPSLEKFQQVGESFGDTVIRVANDLKTVNLSFEELDFILPKLAETGASATAEQLARLTTAQAAYASALAATKVESTQKVMQGDTEMDVQVIGSAAATAALSLAQRELTESTNAVNLANSSLTTKNIDLAQSLIKSAGGIDAFVEKNRFFAENFLTEAERLVPVERNLKEALAGLGLSSLNTRDQFKELVLSLQDLNNPLNITTKDGEKLYTALMNLAPAFAQVYQEAQNASMSVLEFSTKVMGNEVDILKMQASLLESNKDYQGAYTKLQETLLITRKAELTELEKLPKAQGDVLILQAKYKWSLEDITNAAKLAEQANRGLIDSYNQQITAQQKLISYLDDAFGMLSQILTLRADLNPGGTDAADNTAIQRTLKLQDLSARYSGAENAQKLKNIVGMQNYIWALEDEKIAKDNYVKALEAQKVAIQAEIADLQKSLVAYDKLIDQKVRIDELTAANVTQGKVIARERELSSIREEYAGALGVSIARNQEYIWALEDEDELKQKLIQTRDAEQSAIENTISTIKDAISSIKEYRKSLMFSSTLSVLTPEQQYREAKTLFEETLTAARTTGADEAGVQAQQKALAGLPEASDRLLELSRTLFASSSNYMVDYKVVQDALTMTESALGEQLTDAEKQLEELKESTKFLTSIEENTKKTADLLIEYGVAQKRTEDAQKLVGKETVDQLKASREGIQTQIKSKLEDIEKIDRNLETLTGKTLIAVDAATAATKAATASTQASATYQAAINTSTTALANISGDVNSGTIAQAIVVRQAALDAITNAKEQIELLQAVKNNTYAVYQSQVAHFQNLISTPQTVNVGQNVATLLATIVANTAATANNVGDVKTAVQTGAKIAVTSNATIANQNTEAIVAAVGAQTTNWKASTVPAILSGSGVIKTIVTTQPQ